MNEHVTDQLSEYLDGAQKIILAEMQVQFAGAAEAAASSLDKLKVLAGNLGEALGGLLLPGAGNGF